MSNDRASYYERIRGQLLALAIELEDRLTPDQQNCDWWRPGNLRRLGPIEIHFCDDDHVRAVELNGKVIGQGRRLFPYGRWDS